MTHHVAKSGSRMILPTRCGENDRQHLKVMGDLGQIVQLDYNIRDEEAIRYAVERSNVVINMVGREWETRNFSFDDVHVTFPKKLAEICVGGTFALSVMPSVSRNTERSTCPRRTKMFGSVGSWKMGGGGAGGGGVGGGRPVAAPVAVASMRCMQAAVSRH